MQVRFRLILLLNLRLPTYSISRLLLLGPFFDRSALSNYGEHHSFSTDRFPTILKEHPKLGNTLFLY